MEASQSLLPLRQLLHTTPNCHDHSPRLNREFDSELAQHSRPVKNGCGVRLPTGALNVAAIPYAVIGGNAVGKWISKVDPSAVRNTVEVDILVRRTDFPRVTEALNGAGFVWRHAAGIDIFLDGPDGRAREAVHVLFAGEKVRREYDFPAAEVSESEMTEDFRVLTFDALVRMKLTSYRRKDQMHLLDMMGVGLIDESWRRKLPQQLADRLKLLIDTRDDDDYELPPLDPAT